MKDQHKAIKGYRDLSQEEIDLMNEIKQKEAELGKLFQKMRESGTIDRRWLSIAQTDLEKGFMAAVRSVAQPQTEFNK